MKTILVPLDGSLLAEQILPYVRVLAPLLDAAVRLVQVAPEPEPESMLAESVTGLYSLADPGARQHVGARAVLDETVACAEAYLAACAARLEAEGLHVSYDVQIGPAADIIVDIAHDPQIKLIAMATHGYSGFRRWALGSVADRVVQVANTPVFLIRATKYTPAKSFKLARVLLPLDGSDLALQALPIARELVCGANAELLLVEAVSATIEAYPSLMPQLAPQGVALGTLHEYASHSLNNLAQHLHDAGVTVTAVVQNGHAAEVIVDESNKRNVSLIVMATHGRGGLRRWAMGSVADKVLHAANVPLVLVRAH